MAEITSGTIPPGIIVDARNNLIAQSTNPQDLLRNVNNPSLEATDGSQVASESSDAQEKLRTFWQRQMEEIQQMSNVTEEGFKTQELPLARIKKIMKMDEDVKMISAEAPLLFSKAAQMFITELSLRAWIHTEESKRRTLQRNDIATAITKFDQFDFLIDIVPREEIKPPKRTFGPGASSDGSQFFYSVPQQGNTAANNPTNVTQTAIPTSALQTGQLLIAQQNQNGQPMTLTPFNLDNGQVLQLAQPAAQQQSQSNQQTQQQGASLVLSPSSATVNQNQGVQMQKLSQISAQTNEQKQQTAQALLQDLVNNLPNNQAGVHTIQLNAQGQLQLVKVANPQQSQNATGTERQQLVTDDNQLFGISSGTQQQSDSSVNTIFPE